MKIEGNVNDPVNKVGIAVARWNSMITDSLLDGAVAALKSKGLKQDQILILSCPGSFELPLTAKKLADRDDIDGVVTLGAVIRGDTPHFDYVCKAVTDGVLQLNLQTNKPVIFGVLTTDNTEQALERAGDKGNKGAEAALAVLEMISLLKKS
jgi:6,7-dimethyl-8-ribityllumazine synthase